MHRTLHSKSPPKVKFSAWIFCRCPRTANPRGTRFLAFVSRLVLVWGFALQVRAADSTNVPPSLPPPDFLRDKPALPERMLSEKRSGTYITGFPAIGWDPETGFNYGAAIQWFDNGPADSPYFPYTPYRRRLALGATGSTGG